MQQSFKQFYGKYRELILFNKNIIVAANRVRSRTYEVMRDRIPPMKLETLKEKNPELYRQLSVPL